MLIYLTIALVAATAEPMTVKTDLARLDVTVASGNYTYELTNLSDSPIVDFQIPQHAAHLFTAPQGWRIESSPTVFKATATEPFAAIEPDESATFTFRVSSKGAVLGRIDAVVKFQSGQETIISEVPAPTPEPKNYIMLVGGAVLAVMLIQTLILIRRRRRAGKTPFTAA